MFWKMHEKKLPEVFKGLSDDLKDLIVGLFQFNPVHRLSLSEIINHKWLQGTVATKEEIYLEFMYVCLPLILLDIVMRKMKSIVWTYMEKPKTEALTQIC
jgi:hypothetical protein